MVTELVKNGTNLYRSQDSLIRALNLMNVSTGEDLTRFMEGLGLRQSILSPAFRWSIYEDIEYEGFKYEAPYKGLILPTGRKIEDLTPTEFGVAGILIVAGGQVVERSAFCDRLVIQTLPPHEKAVDTHVSRLRKHIGPEGIAFEAVRGLGYRLNPSLVIKATV